MREAEKLARAGVKELLVISQDTSAYGRDVNYANSQFGERVLRTRFLDLARALGALDLWVRLHYVYPYPHVDDVIDLMADGNILPYLDIPFQHAAPNVLKAMKRPANEEKTLARIKDWRRRCPDLTLRSTFIVGFPGETESDFQTLLDWLDEAEIDRAGAFKYEAVAGAPANNLGLEHIAPEIKEARWRRFMEKQQTISQRLMKRKIGKRLSVIIDDAGGGSSGILAKGRSKADAPQIDGVAYVSSRRPLRAGDIISVKVEKTDAYDIYGAAV